VLFYKGVVKSDIILRWSKSSRCEIFIMAARALE